MPLDGLSLVAGAVLGHIPRWRSDTMTTLYTALADVEKIHGVHRRARIATGADVEMGVHGPIARHFKLAAEPLPLPVDYIVAATAG